MARPCGTVAGIPIAARKVYVFYRLNSLVPAVPRTVALVAIVLSLSTFALAQTETSTVAGVVRDSLGGTIPGAIVRIINGATSVSVEAVSDEQGAYRSTRRLSRGSDS
jgi:hypothetical protein